MLDELITDLGDMYKAVLVHAQINERTEVDDIAHGAGQLHAGLEIFQAHDIAAQQGLGQAVAYVAARLTQLGHDVVQRRLANAQHLAQVLGALSLDGGRQTRQFVAADLGSGVATGIQQGLGGGDADTLVKRVQTKLAAEGKPTHAVLCHRLDTGTSGLVLLAKNNAAEAFLTEAIKKREIEKRYLCVTFGRPNPPAALLRDYLLKDAERGIVRITDTTAGGAKEVITGYETLAVSGRLALLEVELVTGRTHQIRAHLAHIGCPILGDSKYGNNAANRELRLKYQALCAWELKFPAKISDERFAHLTGRVFHAEKPWYCQQVEDGTLK